MDLAPHPPRRTQPVRLPKGFALGEHIVDGWIRDGGMAAIYRGRRTTDDHRVAIKLQLLHTAQDPKICAHFDLEAEALQRVEGTPQIVELYDAGVLDDGRRYLVVEWMEGEDLEEVIDLFRNQDRRLAVSRVCRIGQQIALALTALHERDLVHRDLKPANVMVDPKPGGTQEIVKLLDFGIVADLRMHAANQGNETNHEVIGTSAYMPPEQAAGETPTPALDLYSLGVVLFEALSGNCVPPDGWSPETLPRVDTLRRGIPEELTTLVHRCIRSEPHARPTSAAAVAKRLGWIAKRLEAQHAGRTSQPPSAAPSRTGATELMPFPTVEAEGPMYGHGGTEVARTHQQTFDQSGLRAPLHAPPPPALDGPDDANRPLRIRWLLAPLAILAVGRWLWVGGISEHHDLPRSVPAPAHNANSAETTLRPSPREKAEPAVIGVALEERAIEGQSLESSSDKPEQLEAKISAPNVSSEIRVPDATPDPREPEPEVRTASAELPLPIDTRSDDPTVPSANGTAHRRTRKPTAEACEAMRDAGVSAKKTRNWKKVLEATKARACWSMAAQKLERKRLRVTAFAETGRYRRCVAEGGTSRDEIILPRTNYCKKRLEG